MLYRLRGSVLAVLARACMSYTHSPQLSCRLILAFIAWFDVGPELRLIYATTVFVTTLIIYPG